MAKSTHRGHCQACGRLQMLPSGVLAKHGYNVTSGYFSGTCAGSGRLPFEKAADLVQEFIWSALKQRANVANFQETLRAPATIPQAWIRAYVSSDEIDRAASRSRGGYFWMNVELRERANDPSRVEFDAQHPAKKGTVLTHSVYGYPKPSLLEEATALNTTYANWLQHEVDSLTRYIAWQTDRVTNWKEADLFPVDYRDKEGFEPTKPKY